MAVSPLKLYDVSDLCIGKPPLRSLPAASATVADALAFLRLGSEPRDAAVAVWPSSPDIRKASDAPAGKVRMVDVLLHLCAEKSLASPAAALAAPVSVLLSDGADGAARTRRVEPNASILEALASILDGAQSLVVPIRGGGGRGGRKYGRATAVTTPAFCWLTAEDFVRFFLNSIAIFSSIASTPIAELGVVRPVAFAVRHSEPALSAVPLLRAALAEGTSVAVLSDDGRLVGEISPSTLAGCDESVAAAIAALSAGELIAYIDCCGAPPESLVASVSRRLELSGLVGMLDFLDAGTAPSFSSASSSPSASSDDDDSQGAAAGRSRPVRRTGSYSARVAEEAIVCHPGSSLVAVMIQAVAHRVGYVWVVDDDDGGDGRLAGIVGLTDILRVLFDQLQ